MEVHRSARKHGIADRAMLHAAKHPLVTNLIEDDNPSRELRIGFDQDGILLETVVLKFDDGDELVIHAMLCRTKYIQLLP